MRTVLVTARSFSRGTVDVEARLVAAGLDVVRGPATHDLEALREPLARSVAWIAGTGPVTAAHLRAAPDLKVIARYGVGVDAVDIAAAAAQGVVVANTPGANSEGVADHALALLLAALRGVVAGDRHVRAGDWRVERTRELSSLAVGIVGVGRIGRAVARRLTGFGAACYGVDPQLGDDELLAAGLQPGADAIPAEVDIVSLHAPGVACIVDREWLRRARPGLILVNTARGSLVDEDAVADAIRSGQLGAYAADAFAIEGGPGAGPLLAPDIADRVVLTPHWAAQTVEAVDRMGSMAVDAVTAVLDGRVPTHTVSEEQGHA